tara:strand:- start:1309 stop:1776 length:468 start_codon:yes stop_codon:yes gene_type:complete
MKRLLIAPLIFTLISPIPSHSYWFRLTEEEQSICRKRAAKERNEFSAKQTYDYCKQTIKKELKAKEKALSILKAKKEKWNQCAKPFESDIQTLHADGLSISNGTIELPPDVTRDNAKALLDSKFIKNRLAKRALEKEIENACSEKPSGNIFKDSL